MKKKIVKVATPKNITDRLAGIATFRITGPNKAGERVTTTFTGTRKQAEGVVL